MEIKDYKNYFLGLMSAENSETLELHIISNDEAEAELLEAENDLIEDFLDGNLTNEEIKAFNLNFLITKERRERVEFVQMITDYAQDCATKVAPIKNLKPNFFEQLKSFLNPRKFALGFGIALILTIGFISYLGWNNFSGHSEIVASLNKAYKNDRPTEARISDFDYAPKTEGTRGNGDKTQDLNLVSAKSRATEAVLKDETAENLHELGRVYLAEKNFDEAIKQFEKAIKKNPNIATLHNDLGAALMEKAKQKEEGKLELFAKANEEIEKSIELDKNLTAAYFNRGLVIESLNLPNQAREAWENYLKLDPSSQWADEAREHLQNLETNKPVSKTKEEILQDFLQAKQANDTEKAWQTLSRNREMITGKLIPQQLAFLFVDSKTNDDEAKAKEALDALVYVGKLEEEKSGDLFWRDLATYYSNVSADKIPILKQAQESYFEAVHLESEGKLEKSLNKFESASNLFYSTNNLWVAKLCDYWIGSLNFRLNQLEKSEKMFKLSASYANNNGYKWLATHTYVRLSYIAASVNNHSKSIDYCNLALNLAQQTNDSYNLQRIFYSLAYNYRCLKRWDISLTFSEKSFSIAKENGGNLTQLWDTFDSATAALFEGRYFKTAICFQKEALRISEQITDKFAEHLSRIYLGILYAEVNEYGNATTFFEESRKLVSEFEDQQVKEKGLALINLKQGNLERKAGNWYKALELFNRASEFYVSSEFHIDEYESRKDELLCYFALKDDSAIQQHVPMVLDIFKRYRTEILEEQNRNSFFDKEQSVYDLAIGYEYGNGNTENAFNYSEDSRSRSLLDLLNDKANLDKQEIKFSKKTFEPLSLGEIRSQMSEKTQILQYSVLENKVLIWLISKTDFSVTTTDISADDLKQKVNSYLESLARKEGDEKSLSEELFQLLIKPMSEKLVHEKQICIVADKFLFYLPFSALLSPKTKHYLIMDYDLLFSPSANVFLISSNRAKEYEENLSENILVIGNPSFNQDSVYNLNLSKLPNAENEANKIGEFYQTSKVLIGSNVDKKTVKDYFQKSEIIHFAGHYMVNETSPMLSSFILKDDETLDNIELFNENLSKTKLIILSACQTGIERYYQGEGMIGASRTFLAKGIPIVVASQWSVDSEATSELMIRLHYYRKNEQLSTAQALRKSQIDLINSENKKYQIPYYWAAFEVFGGDARF